MKKNFIGFIFARKNSKRLPKKNILKLGNKLLIEYTLLAALKSNIFKKIIVSTDDKKILYLKKKYKKVLFYKRPKSLALSSTKNIDVINYYLKKLDIEKKYGYFSLMLPTCPFRNENHIIKGKKIILNNKNLNCVFSATQSSFPIQFCLKVKNGFAKPYFKRSPLLKNNTRSQNQSPTYIPNGGFWICNTKKFLKSKNFYKGKIKIVEMLPEDSVDIDNQFDFKLAQFILKTKKLNS